MSRTPAACAALAADLIAAAVGEASRPAAERIDDHVARCEGCRAEYRRYREVDAVVGELHAAPAPGSGRARARLLAELADLRARIVRYAVVDSPLGPILLAATEAGVSLVEYLGRARVRGSALFRQTTLEPHEGGAALEPFQRDLAEWFAGRRTRLDWPLDLRLARSDFHRAVLAATAAVPFGAVSSYAGIARDIGRPAAVRAVAQALRHNPVPIVVPCHRVIGSGGALVGYAGHRIGLKERLLDLEGVRTERRRGGVQVDRRAMYAWDRSDREYCLPTCGDISTRPIGRVTLFASARQAEALGLRPCGDCRPDLHPLEA